MQKKNTAHIIINLYLYGTPSPVSPFEATSPLPPPPPKKKKRKKGETSNILSRFGICKTEAPAQRIWSFKYRFFGTNSQNVSYTNVHSGNWGLGCMVILDYSQVLAKRLYILKGWTHPSSPKKTLSFPSKSQVFLLNTTFRRTFDVQYRCCAFIGRLDDVQY